MLVRPFRGKKGEKMSRSIHETIRSVFSNKSKKQIDEMCEPDNIDPDVLQLKKKSKLKKKIIMQRKINRLGIKNENYTNTHESNIGGCFLKVFSTEGSFLDFSKKTRIPICSIYEKNDDNKNKYYRISFDVSKKGADDFSGQIKDSIYFLKKYLNELEELLHSIKIDDAYLDFSIISRLDGIIVNQNDHIPRELISIAGKLPIGIEMSIYSKELFDN
jgi:hypothetical protein